MGCGSSQLHQMKRENFSTSQTVKRSKLDRNSGSINSSIIILPSENPLESSLFKDAEFVYENNLKVQNNNDAENNMVIEWIRPHQLVSRPQLYVDGTSRRDVIQGILGDCWLLSTCAALAKKVG